jgi:hypothetical protein
LSKSSILDSKTRTSPLAEVISSSITTIVAQSLHDGEPSSSARPNFGSFIIVDSVNNVSVIAVVHDVTTGSPDNVHRPSALGLSREQLRIEQPQIFALLRTEIQATIVGYVQAGKVFQHLPAQPPEVHDFVYGATPEAVLALTEEFDFLRLLASASTVAPDELLAATIREAYGVRQEDYQFLVRAGQALSQLFRQDYDRLVCVLRKIKPDR